MTFHVPYPDLVIDSITPNPLNPQPGQPVTYTVHLRNAGAGASPTAGYLGLFIDHSPDSVR